MYTLSGMIAAEGVAAGPAFCIYQEKTPDFVDSHDEIIDSHGQVGLLIQAIKDFTNKLKHAMTGPIPDDVRDLFGAACGFISNDKNVEKIINLIQDGVSAQAACNSVFFEHLQYLNKNNDPEIKKFSRELYSIANEFIATLNQNTHSKQNNINLNIRSVIIARNLTPAALLCLRTDLIAAVILEDGIATSHLGTILRELRIPALFGVNGALQIKDKAHVLVDAINGQVIVEPPLDTAKQMLESLNNNEPIQDEDNYSSITISSSVGATRDYNAHLNFAKHGLGLLRSEFLFIGNQVEPSEKEMIDTFSKIFEKIPISSPINARTFDFAEDKKPNFVNDVDDQGPLKGYGANVGTRLLKKELRALLQAMPNRKITIVFPLIVRISEAQYLNSLVASVYEELISENKKVSPFDVALMIETPAAVLSAKAFTKYSSQFLIGTSSLAQYACAPRPLDHSFTPALAKMIALACKAASDDNIPIAIAGRFAHRLELLPLFLHLGATNIIVDSVYIPKIKAAIDKLNIENKISFDENIYNKIMQTSKGDELNALVNKIILKGF